MSTAICPETELAGNPTGSAVGGQGADGARLVPNPPGAFPRRLLSSRVFSGDHSADLHPNAARRHGPDLHVVVGGAGVDFAHGLPILAFELVAVQQAAGPDLRDRPIADRGGPHDLGALTRLQTGAATAPAEKPKPAVSPKKSVFDDYIVCLEDGKKFKSLKRHLRTHYDLSPEEYREKWGLAADYPMVAPSYAAARSKLARDMGLGRKKGAKRR